MFLQNTNVIIKYMNQDVLVPKEVVEFIEQDRKRMSALRRSDSRHLMIINPDETLGLY